MRAVKIVLVGVGKAIFTILIMRTADLLIEKTMEKATEALNKKTS